MLLPSLAVSNFNAMILNHHHQDKTNNMQFLIMMGKNSLKDESYAIRMDTLST